jgi:hypothetical protein
VSHQYAEFHIVGEYSRAFAVQAMPGSQIVYDATGGAADVALGLWTLLLSWVVIRHGRLPRWLGYFGLLVGLVDFLGLAGPPVGELISIVWFMAVGIVMVRAPSLTARTEPQAAR